MSVKHFNPQSFYSSVNATCLLADKSLYEERGYQKTPMEYVGERVLRPLIDKTKDFYNRLTLGVDMSTMHAVTLKGFGNASNFAEAQVAKPEPETDQVCIRIKSIGFNPVDWKIREGWYGGDHPEILGCDCSGVVESVGGGVDTFKKGDEVYAMSFVGTGRGSYAEYTCVPKQLAAKKPDNLSHDEAAAVPLAAMTAYRATIANRAFEKGDRVFIAGAGGGVGSFAIQMLRHIGVDGIFTVAKNEESAAAITKNLGIPRDHIQIYEGLSDEELETKIKEMNGGKLFDATLDLVGGKTKALCLNLTGHSGHFSTILPEDKFEYPFWGENDKPRARNLSVHQVNIGSQFGSSNPEDLEIYTVHMAKITKMFQDGVLKAPSVQNVGSLSQKTVQKAHELLESGRTKGKLVMEVRD